MPTTRTRRVKGWIQTFWGGGSPSIHFRKPGKKEVEFAEEYGSHFYPCTVIYQLPKTKKKGRKNN